MTVMNNNLQVRVASQTTSLILWGAAGWAIAELAMRWTSWPDPVIQAFAAGAGACFLTLTVAGTILQKRRHNQASVQEKQMLQQQTDWQNEVQMDLNKAELERQYRMDQAIIEQLRNEHALSGDEQDRRLKALEAALKHLRGK
jgi:hypothetical protein